MVTIGIVLERRVGSRRYVTKHLEACEKPDFAEEPTKDQRLQLSALIGAYRSLDLYFFRTPRTELRHEMFANCVSSIRPVPQSLDSPQSSSIEEECVLGNSNLQASLKQLEQHIQAAETHLRQKDLFSAGHETTAAELCERYQISNEKVQSGASDAEAHGHHVGALEQ